MSDPLDVMTAPAKEVEQTFLSGPRMVRIRALARRRYQWEIDALLSDRPVKEILITLGIETDWREQVADKLYSPADYE